MRRIFNAWRRFQCWMLENEAATRGHFKEALMWAKEGEKYR